jgi:pheromone shutdown protein TraB
MVIGGLYTKLNQMGFSSGQEFVVAIREAKALNATIVLGDRGVDQTLSRLQESLDKSGFGAVQKFIERQQENEVLITGGMTEAELADDKESLTKTIEALKERRTVRALMATLKESLPEVHAALIAERDAFMANSLLQAKGRNTVAVVGMAHMDGIEANLGDTGFKKVVCSIS